MHRRSYEVVIVGGGIAGASLAYFLTARGVRDVLLLEREAQPGYHSTGRSAAVAVEWDPIPALQALKVQGAAFLRQPPTDFASAPLLRATGHPGGLPGAAVGRGARRRRQRWRPAARRSSCCPPPRCWRASRCWRRTYVDGGVLLPGRRPHRGARAAVGLSARRRAARGGALLRRRRARRAHARAGGCAASSTSAGDVDAPWVVNAAGAWAGVVAASAGASPIPAHARAGARSSPSRCPTTSTSAAWPLVEHESQQLYFGARGGRAVRQPDGRGAAGAVRRDARRAGDRHRAPIGVGAPGAAPGAAPHPPRLGGAAHLLRPTACWWSARIRACRDSSGSPARAAAASRPAARSGRSPPICCSTAAPSASTPACCRRRRFAA